MTSRTTTADIPLPGAAARSLHQGFRHVPVLAALLLFDGLLAILAATIGPADISFVQVCRTLGAELLPGSGPVNELHRTIVLNVRLPRILMANLAGFGLGIAGAAMQSVLKNPLASPYTLGISAGAGFGAALAIVLGVGVLSGTFFIAGNAFVFALLTAFVVLALSGRRQAPTETMILAGIALMFLFSSGITLLQFIADPYAVQAVVFWLIGDVGRATWQHLHLIGLVLGLVTPYLVFKGWDMEILSFGDDTATALGVHVGWTRRGIMLACSLLTAAIVSFVGTIGFIGLVAPHIVRLALRGGHRIHLIGSGLTGAILLSSADMAALTLLAPNVLPIGVVTALMGVPLFLYFVLFRKEST
jgi:iron complex transport system permease protein